MGTAEQDIVPAPGNWPVDPQEDVAISEDRIWVDGCFDFAHHGHAGAMLQARRLGKELLIGVHSDEAILHHKGPTVMTLKERVLAVDACRWSTLTVPHAPYVTSLPWISHYGCQYVVHGDDITSDSNGEDCYRFVKEAGRFRVVKRTPGISTTDLVGRMLLCTKNHFIRSLPDMLTGKEGSGDVGERILRGKDMTQRIRDYATDQTGLNPGAKVFSWTASPGAKEGTESNQSGECRILVDGKGPQPHQRIIYVDGGFDLFSSGHIEFLKQVVETEERLGQSNGSHKAVAERGDKHSYYIIVGVHDDAVINSWKGVNYPIMNIFERGLCVLQCRFVDSVIFSAPFTPSEAYLAKLPFGTPHAVYHGAIASSSSTSSAAAAYDHYADAKSLGIYRELSEHEFQDVNAGEIVHRVLRNREMFEERQKKKGEKASTEEAVRRREELEREAARLQRERVAPSGT